MSQRMVLSSRQFTDGPWWTQIRSSVRAKLLAMVLLPLVIVSPAVIAVGVIGGGAAYDELLIHKVRSDLAVADGYFERVRDGVGSSVVMLAASHRMASALQGSGPSSGPIGLSRSEQLTDFLRASKASLQLDFLHFIDNQGRVVASSDLLKPGVSLDRYMAVASALGGNPATVLDVFSAEHLEAIHPDLAERANIALRTTRNAAHTDKQVETRGMVVHTAAPVLDTRNRPIGALVGGLLLNRNLRFVDRINEIIYPEGALPKGSHGTATLFLDDVRIATNVRLFAEAGKEERAIGTRVSAAVRNSVLGDGATWLDRAFVVNDWYVSAYQPVTDGAGQRIGMLYVGYLETPFRRLKYLALAVMAALFLITMMAATFVALRWARSIFRPLERMNDTMSAIEMGQADARVGPVALDDEVGQLANHFDQLLNQLQARNEALKRWGEELDLKVAERTQALEASNRELREAQRQLVMSEKLAAIGELTAGVAHEINNPVAVIQGNLDLMRELLGDAAVPLKSEFKLMDDQVERIRLIITKLLQFARPAEFAGYLEPIDPGSVLVDSLVLVGPLLKRGNVAIQTEAATTRTVLMNRNELQQVLINLMVNAIQAMPEGGTLTLRAEDWNDPDAEVQGVCLKVRDTGQGIDPAHLDRIFNPFFSTKGQGGTGLGLSVSYGLVERFGGRISVKSTVGVGSEFIVWLPGVLDQDAAINPIDQRG